MTALLTEKSRRGGDSWEGDERNGLGKELDDEEDEAMVDGADGKP